MLLLSSPIFALCAYDYEKFRNFANERQRLRFFDTFVTDDRTQETEILTVII
jgi:hypothetical protein